MIWLKIIILSMVIIGSTFIIGNFICRLLKFEQTLAKNICIGFVFILAVFQIIAYPFSIFKGSFKVLVFTYVIILIALLVLSIPSISSFKLIFKLSIKDKVLFGLIISLILLQSLFSSYLYHADDDDAYFVTVSSTVIETDIISSNTQYVTTGIDTLQVDTRSNTATWEYFVAFLSEIYSVEPVIIAHAVLPLLLIPLSYLAIYLVAVQLVNKASRMYFMLVYALLNLFGGYAVYSTACFLLLRIWQGKAVLVCIIFPVLLANCIELILSNKQKKNFFLYNAVILLAGVCTSVIGVYLTPIYYFIIGVPYMISIGWKESKKLIIPTVLSLVPCGSFALISFIQVIKNNSEYLNAPSPSWFDIFKLNMMSGYYSVLYLISLIYILIKGKRIHKIILFWGTVFIFLTFLNPLFSKFVSQKITGVDVYWRLYWTLPIYYSISFFVSEILCKIKNIVLKCVCIISLTGILTISGHFIYQKPYFSRHENMYKLPNEVISIVDYILDKNKSIKKPNVLFPDDLAAKVRQYSTKVVTVWSRNLYQGNTIIPNTDKTLNSFYYSLYSDPTLESETIYENLKFLGVEWLIMPENNRLINNENIILQDTLNGYSIYYIYLTND